MAEKQQQQTQEQKPSLLKTLIAGMLGMEPAPPGSQPKLGAEIMPLVRQGREDFLNVIMGGLAGSREPGTPGTPTQQLVTESLKLREVDSRTDQLQPRQKHSLDDYRAMAEERAQAAEHRMDHQNDQQQQREMGRSM